MFWQNADLQARVHYLEGCECVRRRCVWEGRDVEEGQRWQTHHSVCTCTSGKVKCQASVKGKKRIYLSVVNSTNQRSEPEQADLRHSQDIKTHRLSGCGVSLFEPGL